MALTAQSLSISYRLAAAHVGPKWLTEDGIVDNAFAANATLQQFKRRFRMKRLAGGERVFWGVRLEKGGGEGSYSGFDTVDVTPPDTDTVAQANTKEYWRPVAYSYRDRDLVRGPRAFAEEFRIRLEQALKRIGDDLNIHGQSDDGSGNGSKRIRGMKLWIAADPTAAGTPGGVDQANNSNWRNQRVDNSNTLGDLLLDLRSVATLSKSGNEGPTFIICNRSFRDALEGTFTDTFQHNPVITSAGEPNKGKMGDPAIGTLYYRGIPIYEDESYTQYGTTTGPGEALGIREQDFAWVNALENARYEGLFEYVEPVRGTTQTAEVGGVRAHLELICFQRRRSFIIHNVAADA